MRTDKLKRGYDTLKAIFLGLVVSMVISGCIDKPVAPIWDVELNAPLVNRTYTVEDMIKKDSTRITTDPANKNLLYYGQQIAISPIMMGDKLKLNPISAGSSVSLGKINFTNPDPVPVDISSSSIIGVSGPATLPFPVTAFSKTVPPTALTVTAFQSATFASGKLWFVATNRLGSNLTINVTQIRILDASSNVIVSANTSLSLDYLKTDSTYIDISGKTFPSNMKIEVTLSSPGSGTNFPVLPADSKLSVLAKFTDLTPSSVTAIIPQQDTIKYNGNFSLDNDPTSSIQLIEINSGTLNFSVTNNFNVDITTRFTFPNLITEKGIAFDTVLALTPGVTNSVIRNVAGWNINFNSSLNNNLSFSVKALVKGSSTAKTISTSDKIDVSVTMSELSLKSLTGRIKRTQLDNIPTSFAVHLGSFDNFKVGKLQFKDFGVTLKIASSPTVPLGFSGKVYGRIGSTQKASFDIPSQTLPGGGNSINYTPNNTDLNNFVNSFLTTPPEWIDINLSGLINPNSSSDYGRINNQDSISGSAMIHMPLDVGISGGTLTDTVSFEIPESAKKEAGKIQSVDLTLDIENGIAATVKFHGIMFDSTQSTPSNLLVDSLSIPPYHSPNPTQLVVQGASVDSYGFSALPGKQSIVLDITGDDVQRLLRMNKMIMYISLDTPVAGASPVKFTTADRVVVKASGKLIYRIQK